MDGIIIFNYLLIIKSSKNDPIFIKNILNKKCHSFFNILRKPRNQGNIFNPVLFCDVEGEQMNGNNRDL